MNRYSMRKVGETFDYNGVILRVERHDSAVCEGCYFDDRDICKEHDKSVTGSCYDAPKLINIVFKKVEGGENVN